VFDFLDGAAARLFDAKSDTGKDLDSLADVVSFGVVPGMILFKMMEAFFTEGNYNNDILLYIPFVAFLLPLFSALRLAQFNNDERQTDAFIGLPTPASAILIASFPLILKQQSSSLEMYLEGLQNLLTNVFFLLVITIALSFLLIAELPLFSLKFKNFSWSENKIRFIFMGVSIISFVFLYYSAIPIIILLYILISLFTRKSEIRHDIS
jgi:CDP-diacylglycerol--serine O-phosphatidyltransferase